MIKKSWVIATFVLYCICLVLFVILKFDGSFERILSLQSNIVSMIEEQGISNVNLVPFRTISPYLGNFFAMYAFVNIMGNIVIFAPLGFLLRMLSKNSFSKVMIISLLIIFSIELIQYFFKIGFFDIDDILLNTIGACLGYVASVIFDKMLIKKISNTKES